MLQHIVFRDHCWLQDGLGRSFLDAISGSDLGTLRGKVLGRSMYSPDEVGCLSSVLSEVIWAITTMAMTGSWNLSTQYLLGLGYEQARIWPALKI